MHYTGSWKCFNKTDESWTHPDLDPVTSLHAVYQVLQRPQPRVPGTQAVGQAPVVVSVPDIIIHH